MYMSIYKLWWGGGSIGRVCDIGFGWFRELEEVLGKGECYLNWDVKNELALGEKWWLESIWDRGVG